MNVFAESVHDIFCDSKIQAVIVQAERDLEISSLARAVVILHAPWSGPSGACLRQLASLPGSPVASWLYVVNIDAVSPAWIERNFGRVSHGRGEIFWIENGCIQHKDEGYARRPDDVIRATNALFQ